MQPNHSYNRAALITHAVSMKKKIDSNKPEKRMSPENIRSALSRIVWLAPLPTVIQEILEASRDPNTSAKYLADIIRRDQSITAKILKIVNSAYFGFPREIGNIDRAIVILGFNDIRDITIAVCLKNTFDHPENDLFDRDKFWVHSLAVAYIARALSSRIDKMLPSDAFVMGLLHDFGKAILNEHFHDEFLKCLRISKNSGQPLHLVCYEKLGIDHAEVGGIIADSWKLPIPLVNAIKYHHNPVIASRENKEVHLAHVANVLAHNNKIGHSGNLKPDPVSSLSLEILGIKPDGLPELWESLKIDPEYIRNII